MPKLQDFSHDDWLRWMQATPEGITLYADDAVIERLEAILLPYSQVFGDRATTPASEIGYRTLSGSGVTIRRKSQVVREGIEQGRELEREAIMAALENYRPAPRRTPRLIVMVVTAHFHIYKRWVNSQFPHLHLGVPGGPHCPFEWVEPAPEGELRTAGYSRGTLYVHLDGVLSEDFRRRFNQILLGKP